MLKYLHRTSIILLISPQESFPPRAAPCFRQNHTASHLLNSTVASEG